MLLPKPSNQRRPETWPLVAGVFVLCAFVALSVKALKESQASELLENVEIVPVQQYMVVERPTMRRYPFQSLKVDENLPAERWYEADGIAPGSMKDVGSDENPAGSRCPGAWCAEDPVRPYPDSRAGWPAGASHTLAWGPCNIALQDC